MTAVVRIAENAEIEERGARAAELHAVVEAHP